MGTTQFMIAPPLLIRMTKNNDYIFRIVFHREDRAEVTIEQLPTMFREMADGLERNLIQETQGKS